MAPTGAEHQAPKCNRWGQIVPKEDFVRAWGRCRACVQRTYQTALSNYAPAMSEEVVEVAPYGWCTAL